MHPSASRFMRKFFDTYVINKMENPLVYEVGSMDNHEKKFNHIPETGIRYVGIDFQHGPNVDVILEDPYKLPFEDNSADVIISTSVFEHCEFFWLTILEMYRVVKPSGLVYINAPSNGSFHQFPIDSWRFYPDSGDSFVNWGKRNGYNPLLLESFIDMNGDFPMSIWNDYVCVILKDATYANLYPDHIIDTYKDVWFGKSLKTPRFNTPGMVEDQLRLMHLMNIQLDETDNNFMKGLKWYGK